MLMMTHRKKTLNRIELYIIYFSILFLFYSQNSQLFFEKLLVKKKSGIESVIAISLECFRIIFFVKKSCEFCEVII
jgi:hypothetical protein